MLRKALFLLLILPFVACETLGDLGSTLGTPLTKEEVARGLKQALEFGTRRGATELSQEGGYFDSAYRILLPEEAQKVTDRLQVIPGFDKLEEEMVRRINRAAEDAATKAAPIFYDAITEMTINDAFGILRGQNDAATRYLEQRTLDKLYTAFQPVILNSLNKFNAVDYWEDAVEKYNRIPLVEDLNPRLDDYVARRALDGLFSQIELEEQNIRANVSARTTELLRRVFGSQQNGSDGNSGNLPGL